MRRSIRGQRVFWVVSGFTWLGGCLTAPGDSLLTVLPPADAEPGRWVVLDGANNTRDIGGYLTMDGRRVRWRTVYRSGSLAGLTPAGCEAFAGLGIRLVVDFRNRLSPLPLFNGDAWCVFLSARTVVHPVGAVGGGDDGLPPYVQMVRDSADSYRLTFEALAYEGNLPLLYHCAGGKDRTGIMTALLLTLLGVDRQSVIADYMLSNEVGACVAEGAVVDLLAEVERQGGIESYLERIGVSAAVQGSIRANLLEEVERPRV